MENASGRSVIIKLSSNNDNNDELPHAETSSFTPRGGGCQHRTSWTSFVLCWTVEHLGGGGGGDLDNASKRIGWPRGALIYYLGLSFRPCLYPLWTKGEILSYTKKTLMFYDIAADQKLSDHWSGSVKKLPDQTKNYRQKPVVRQLFRPLMVHTV